MTPLSPREEMVLRLMWEGMEYKQIAMAMNISVRLVEYQRLRLVTKLGATTSAHLMRRAIEEGMIQV